MSFKPFAAGIAALMTISSAHARTNAENTTGGSVAAATAGAGAVSMILTTPWEPRYCIREVPTGTNVARTFCKSRAEWLRAGLDPIARF